MGVAPDKFGVSVTWAPKGKSSGIPTKFCYPVFSVWAEDHEFQFHAGSFQRVYEGTCHHLYSTQACGLNEVFQLEHQFQMWGQEKKAQPHYLSQALKVNKIKNLQI